MPHSADSESMRFVVFSDDWGVHPSSCQHLFRFIVDRFPVTWINTVGMRPPSFSVADFRKILYKSAKMLSGGKATAIRSPALLTVAQPLMAPYMGSARARRFNRWSVGRTMGKTVGTDKRQRTIVLTTVPNAADYVDLIDADLKVYYCVDDFSEWPGLDKKLILAMESELLQRVDIILATSEGLRARLAETGKPVAMLEHGVDLAHFSQVAAEDHACLRDIPSPRAGFFGLIDGRMDQGLLSSLAKACPDLQIVLAGPAEVSTSELSKLANVHMVGRIPYAELPQLIRGLDTLIIPYKVNELAKALSPLKLKEYLATGKRIISTPIPASLTFGPHVEIAASAEDWTELLRPGVESRTGTRDVHEVLDGQSWREKAQWLVETCRSGQVRAPID
ncbi:MAG: hypothetical protein QNJ07_17310 [Woeseiaceae bacterium]|nr:hypothetical protein [Woeseiaceae bacterium]